MTLQATEQEQNMNGIFSLDFGESRFKVGQRYLLNMKKTVDNAIDFSCTYSRWIVMYKTKIVQSLESKIQLIYHFYLLSIG